MTLTDIVDGAWSVITCRPGTVFGVSALITIPTALIGSILVRRFGDSLGVETVLRVFYPYIHLDNRASPGWPSALAAVGVLSFGTLLLGVAIASLVSGWYDGREITAVQAAIGALRRSPGIFVAFLVIMIPEAIAVSAFLVPALFVFPFFLLVAPVIAIEHVGPFAAIRRSASLVGRRYAAVLWMWIWWLVAERVIVFALDLLPLVVTAFTPNSVDAVVQPAAWAFVLFLTAPAVAAMPVLLYYDLRVRTEGLDLELDAARAFARG